MDTLYPRSGALSAILHCGGVIVNATITLLPEFSEPRQKDQNIEVQSVFLQCCDLEKPPKLLKMSWSSGITRVVSTRLDGLLGVPELSMWTQVSPTKFVLKNYVMELQTERQNPMHVF